MSYRVVTHAGVASTHDDLFDALDACKTWPKQRQVALVADSEGIVLAISAPVGVRIGVEMAKIRKANLDTHMGRK